MRKGIIITAYCDTLRKLVVLRKLLKKLKKETNYFIVLSSHTKIPTVLQKYTNVTLYDSNNLCDERRYSHGVAESMLIEQALNTLEYYKIEDTYKIPFDIELNDVNILNDWNKEGYLMSTAWWNSSWPMGTFAWFANINFLKKYFTFFKDIDSFMNAEKTIGGNVALEKIWSLDLEKSFIKDKIYIYQNYREMFGDKNKIDLYHCKYPE